MSEFEHPFSFDPTYGYSLDTLLAVGAPDGPADFVSFWEERREQAMKQVPAPRIARSGIPAPEGWKGCQVRFDSTGGVELGAVLYEPDGIPPRRGLIFGHGYGVEENEPPPDFLPSESVLFFPYARGLGLSGGGGIPREPARHVLHGIESRDTYLHGGCVDDLWMSVSALLEIFPALEGRLGYLGISFGGGIGALALPWEPRVGRVHFNVPSFGNHPLRLTMPTHGSGEAVRRYARRRGDEKTIATLQYFDAATAARYLDRPVHAALALFDPFVTPAGQFSIYNALPGEKSLFVLDAGHFEYPGQTEREWALRTELEAYFSHL